MKQGTVINMHVLHVCELELQHQLINLLQINISYLANRDSSPGRRRKHNLSIPVPRTRLQVSTNASIDWYIDCVVTCVKCRGLAGAIYIVFLFLVVVILLNLLIAQFTKSYDEEIGRARVSVTLNRAKALSRMWNPLWMKIIVRLKTLLHCILNNNNLHGSDNKEMYFYVVVHSVLFPCHTHVCRCDTGTSLASISEYHTTDQPHLNWTLKVHMSMDALLK